MRSWIAVCLCVSVLLLSSCRAQESSPASPSEAAAFTKAVWIPYFEVEAFLSSGDPSQAQALIAACMEDCRSRGINTVYFHVRANSDAYYRSSVYPQSDLVTSLLSQSFDPLACAVEEAHVRGLSLHAWVNPYRIGVDRSSAQSDDIFEYDGRWYYIPTASSTHRMITDGVRELVDHYAIDGVQFDDYFYPKGAVPAEVPAAFEQDAFASYCADGGSLTVGDWRRAQVSLLIASVYSICHTRSDCLFGVSPSYHIVDNRETMYADVEEWAATGGYVDYLCPQLYLGFSHEYAPFEDILAAWDALPRSPRVQLVAGLALYKTGIAEDPYADNGRSEWANGGDILARQVQAVYARSWQGAALYSHLSFQADDTRQAAVIDNECRALYDMWRNL